MRILGAKQQMLRLDFEEVGDLFEDETERLSEWLLNLIDSGLDALPFRIMQKEYARITSAVGN